jgi:rhodanese-related sulfurtransferase
MTRLDAALAAAAGILGGLAGVVGLAGRGAAALDQPLPALAEAHRVTALELAGWLRDRKPGLTILDVRPDSAAFAEFHLPRARRVPLAALRSVTPEAGTTVVVYADGGDLAARAWLVLRARGHDTVRVLPDGVGDWLRDILSPTLPSDASAEARDAFARQAELARYFGGMPRVVAPGEGSDGATDASSLLRRTARRGCAF